MLQNFSVWYNGTVGKIPGGDLGIVNRLYYQQELGAPQIARKLNVSTDAVYYFMRRHKLARRSFSEENALRFKRKAPSFKISLHLTAAQRELKTIGSMLYWAEGFQADYAQIVDFANSKPEMIVLFLKFLRNVCGIQEPKLRALLYCYADQDVKELTHFWSRITRIPPSRFTKPYVREDFRKEKSGKMRYGLLHVRYCDKKLLDLLRRWIREYANAFAQVDP